MLFYAVSTGVFFALLWKNSRMERIRFFLLVFFSLFVGELVKTMEQEKPDAVMLVEYPGFNLRLAKRCQAMGLRVVYYISPQVWAWRRGRVSQIARSVDRMLVIFPFEESFYREHDVIVT